MGHLGPPEISKLLWEAELFKQRYESLANILLHSPEELSQQLCMLLLSEGNEQMRQTIVSLGLPILLPDATQIIRGPRISIPASMEQRVSITEENVDTWVQKGWVDLRPRNMALWQERFRKMENSRQLIRGHGSAAVTIEGYLYETIHIGEVVGWIFNNEHDGYRSKYGHRMK